MIRFGVNQKTVTWRNVYTQEGKYPLVKVIHERIMGFCVCLVPVPLSHFTSLTYPRRTGGKQFHMVVTRKDTLKSGWTPYVYYITLYSIPREYLFFWEKWGSQSTRQLCKEVQ